MIASNETRPFSDVTCQHHVRIACTGRIEPLRNEVVSRAGKWSCGACRERGLRMSSSGERRHSMRAAVKPYELTGPS